MHELSFAEQILTHVVREARAYPGSTVTRVRLRAGALLALEPSSLRFCLEAISVDTAMEGAEIEMAVTGPELDCPECGRVSIESLLDPVCPQCGQIGQLATGTELIIEEIELDDEEDQTRSESSGKGPRGR